MTVCLDTLTMKSITLLHIILAFAFLCVAPQTFAKPPAITYSGGDGSTLEKAVIIKGATEATGVDAEYAYLQKHFPGCKTGSQSLQNLKGKAYDVLEYTPAGGKKQMIYFDITAFFGKF